MDKPQGRNQGRDGRAPAEPEIDAFALALAGLESEAALEILLARGSATWLRRSVFAPVARRLGDWWVEDRICFATVTLAMSHLQRLAWTHGRATPHATPLRPAMVLATLPGEQHTFGLNMLLEELREQGVEPAALPCPTREALIAAAASGRFAVIGLSAGSEQTLAEVPELTRALRRAASEQVRIVLGGPVVEELTVVPGIDEILCGAAGLARLYALATQTRFGRAAAA